MKSISFGIHPERSVIQYAGAGSLILDSGQMTAISFCYTRSGFVIAADGRSQNFDSITGTYRPDGDKHQKIFPLLGAGRILACAITGSAVASEDNSFNLSVEIERQQKRLATKYFPNLRGYLGALGFKLKKAYEKATETCLNRKSQLDEDESDDVLARLIVMGYVAGHPSSRCVEFIFESKGKVALNMLRNDNQPGIPALFAPKSIGNVIDCDPRFAEYRLPFGFEMPIEQASAVVRRRIEACASTLAAEIEPLCSGIGGHIHIASITPSGFDWVPGFAPYGIK